LAAKGAPPAVDDRVQRDQAHPDAELGGDLDAPDVVDEVPVHAPLGHAGRRIEGDRAAIGPPGSDLQTGQWLFDDVMLVSAEGSAHRHDVPSGPGGYSSTDQREGSSSDPVKSS
jgi:hypothetical protein